MCLFANCGIKFYMVNSSVGVFYVASSYDFEESIQKVTFSSRQTTATVYVKIRDDNRVERTEAFQVEILISRDLYSQGVQHGNPAKAKVYIRDGKQMYQTPLLPSLFVLCVTFR